MIEAAQGCDYINEDKAEQLIYEYQKLGKMIGTMISKASGF